MSRGRDVSSATTKASAGRRRSLIPRREVNARNSEAALKTFRKELHAKRSEMVSYLVVCNGELQKTTARIRDANPRPTATQADFLNDWRRIANNYDQAVSQTRLFAVDAASTVADFLTSVLPYLLDPANPVSEKESQVEAYLQLLSSAAAREEEAKPKLTEVINEMDKFQDRWSTNSDFSELLAPSNTAKNNVRSLLTDLQSEGQMSALLDNSSLPGLMRAMTGLLSNDLIGRLHNLLEGENHARIEANEVSDLQKPCNMFDCFMDVRSILRMDLLASTKQIREGRLDASSSTLDGRSKLVVALYKELENSLKEFATLLADDTQGTKTQTIREEGSSRSKFARFFRRLWVKG